MGTPNREPQEHSRNRKEYKDPGRYIPIIFLLYSWGSLSGVPIKVLHLRVSAQTSPSPKTDIVEHRQGPCRDCSSGSCLEFHGL